MHTPHTYIHNRARARELAGERTCCAVCTKKARKKRERNCLIVRDKFSIAFFGFELECDRYTLTPRQRGKWVSVQRQQQPDAFWSSIVSNSISWALNSDWYCSEWSERKDVNNRDWIYDSANAKWTKRQRLRVGCYCVTLWSINWYFNWL